MEFKFVRGLSIGMLSLAALSGFALAAAARAASDPPATAPATSPGDTVKVKHAALKLTVNAGGAFEPIDPFEVRLRFKSYVGDLIVISAAKPGSQVAKDDIILQIDDKQIQRQLASAENDLSAAKANYEKEQSDVALGEKADALAMQVQTEEVKNSQNALKWWEQVDGKQMLENADLSVQYSKDSVGDQEDELDQLKKMYKSEELTNATADIVVRRALRALKHATISAKMTEERAEKTKSNEYEVYHSRVKRAVEQQQQALDQLKAQQAQARVLRQTALTSAKLAMDAAEERQKNLKEDFAQFTVRAPQSMTIYYGQLTNGSWQNNNPKLLRAGEKIVLNPPHIMPGAQLTGCVPGKLRFSANVPEDKILLVQRGQKAQVTATALPEKPIEGTVADPVRVISDGSSFDVNVDLPGDVPELTPGMKGNMKITSSGDEKSLVLPIGAVKDDKVRIRQSDGTEKEIEVVTGRSDGEFIEIVHGLNDGDEVLSQAKK